MADDAETFSQTWAGAGPPLDAFYPELVARVEVAMRENYARDSCIASAAICLRVIQKLRPKLTPIALPVGVICCTVPMYRWCLEHRRFPEGAEFLDLVERLGFHSVGVDTTQPDRPAAGGRAKGWNGHLVVICEGHLLDPSAGQFSRPGRGIEAGPVAISLSEPVEPEALHTFAEFSSAGLFYWATPENRRYVRSPDWNDEGGRHRETIARVVRAFTG